MKENIKKYFKETRKVVFVLVISVILSILSNWGMFAFYINNQEIVINFNDTLQITKDVLPFTVMVIFATISMSIVTISMMILIIKAMFPNSRAFSSLMMKEESEFLLNLPRKFREGRVDK